ncbi:MAG: hypothetical protein JWR34_4326 [Mycobacterium sp.]|nr:hypothetical protein [Mycobacterium sp.]
MPEPTNSPVQPKTKGDTMTDTDTTTETDEADGGGLGLTGEQWATAAEQLAEEAATAQDGTAEAVDAEEADGTPRDQRHRQRARAAEAERDGLLAVVDGMRHAEVARLVASKLADPADLFRDGMTLADVLDAQGHVDPAKLDTIVDKVIGDHPHWRASVSTHYRGPLHSGATNTRSVDAPAKGFADAFSPQVE